MSFICLVIDVIHSIELRIKFTHVKRDQLTERTFIEVQLIDSFELYTLNLDLQALVHQIIS